MVPRSITPSVRNGQGAFLYLEVKWYGTGSVYPLRR
ncbi:hypothetical protein BACCAP_02019 [Pseudoflavonifractor capillosus ATCC 29799]|uniref:Uncharacterized protein n=1 Tax=Pseudoflavonifractor capillosus ATCC 29799 TaxID=411467 RepID=A6NUY4_9FIRM|nr:hypothetical protein BACCAP_02019 [Pseudoflavonifractor capillosus ATCC 29799]